MSPILSHLISWLVSKSVGVKSDFLRHSLSIAPKTIIIVIKQLVGSPTKPRFSVVV